MTGEAEVGNVVATAMLFRNHLFNMESHERKFALSKTTVLAVILRSISNRSTNCPRNCH